MAFQGDFSVYERGRQVDPLSPLLFVIAVDLLQCIINNAANMGILSAPFKGTTRSDFPVIQYADDTLIIMKASRGSCSA
jgi:hypothetical protein